MGQFKNITEGWANMLLNRQNEISEKRMDICKTCEHISTKHQTHRFDVHCIHCGCRLQAKTRSLESECPIGLWKAEKLKSENEEPKKTFHN